jgi:hypothetical protein
VDSVPQVAVAAQLLLVEQIAQLMVAQVEQVLILILLGLLQLLLVLVVTTQVVVVDLLMNIMMVLSMLAQVAQVAVVRAEDMVSLTVRHLMLLLELLILAAVVEVRHGLGLEQMAQQAVQELLLLDMQYNKVLPN